MAAPQTFIDEAGAHRLKDTEFVLPIIVGTVAFPLGKKATEHVTHRWTVYLRGVNNEDLSHIITRVQFDLHPTFNNAHRVVEQQPYEVTEHGWGEFEIVVHLTFSLDSGESEAIIYHRLRLYDDGEAPGSKQDPRKPVVFETYEEVVFSEPRLEFFQRMRNHIPGPMPVPLSIRECIKPPSEQLELAAIRSARARVAGLMAELRREAAGTQGLLPGSAMMPGMLPPGLGPGMSLPPSGAPNLMHLAAPPGLPMA